MTTEASSITRGVRRTIIASPAQTTAAKARAHIAVAVVAPKIHSSETKLRR